MRLRFLNADGARHDVIFSKSTFPDDSGSAGIVGVILDITDLKRAEQELKISENRFQLIAESIRDVFWMATPDFKKIFYVNPHLKKSGAAPGKNSIILPNPLLPVYIPMIGNISLPG